MVLEMNYFSFNLGCHADGIMGINEVNALVDTGLPRLFNWSMLLNENRSSSDQGRGSKIREVNHD
jgi:hypothetical protein